MSELFNLGALLRENTYPGRGIVAGLTPDGTQAVCAYFIMGRSENSRNRVFVLQDGGVTIYPFDAAKVADPSLIIYRPVAVSGEALVVTNGDQTDTVCEFLDKGRCFEEALETRCFEPDAPNYTPRISAILTFKDGYSYKMSILKASDALASGCNRFTFAYAPVPGLGHFIHTYAKDGNPIPSFTGEPEPVAICGDIDAFTEELWQSLNADNKVSLYTRFTDLATSEIQQRIVNKNV